MSSQSHSRVTIIDTHAILLTRVGWFGHFYKYSYLWRYLQYKYTKYIPLIIFRSTATPILRKVFFLVFKWLMLNIYLYMHLAKRKKRRHVNDNNLAINVSMLKDSRGTQMASFSQWSHYLQLSLDKSSPPATRSLPRPVVSTQENSTRSKY